MMVGRLGRQVARLEADLADARVALGEAWLTSGKTLADGIRAKTAMLEGLAPAELTPADPMTPTVAVPRDLVQAIVDDLREGLAIERLTGDALAMLVGLPWRPQQPGRPIARPLADWSEDDGHVLWWRLPVTEPPYAGSPLDSDWPGYHTHWTPIEEPEEIIR